MLQNKKTIEMKKMEDDDINVIIEEMENINKDDEIDKLINLKTLDLSDNNIDTLPIEKLTKLPHDYNDPKIKYDQESIEVLEVSKI